jgi:hypothetical protein
MRSIALLSLFCLSMLFVGPAAAASEGPAAAMVESFSGDRPAVASSHIRHVTTVLAAQSVLAGTELVTTLHAKVSRPAGSADPSLLTRTSTLFNAANDLYIRGRFAEAEAGLQRTIAELRTNSALVVTQQMAREDLYRSLVILSHAQARQGELAQAIATMSEVIRSFPERRVETSTFGLEVADFYRRVLRDLNVLPRTALRIETDPDVAVFLNERFVGLGGAYLPDLPPGHYRVLTQRKQRFGRVHDIALAGEQMELRIDAGFDAALQSDDLPRLGFPSEKDREAHEARYAQRFGQALAVKEVFILGTRVAQGRQILTGTAISVTTGRMLRSAAVALEPAPPSGITLEALARFLMQGGPKEGLILAVDDAGGDEPHGGPSRVWKWLATISGLAALGLGAYWVAIDGSGTCSQASCPERFQTATQGYVALGLGGGLLVTGGILFYLDSSWAAPARDTIAERAPRATLFGAKVRF